VKAPTEMVKGEGIGLAIHPWGASDSRCVHSQRPWTAATGARERGEWPGEAITAGERENGWRAGFVGLARGENGYGHRDLATERFSAF
jgi:hypothetical protein